MTSLVIKIHGESRTTDKIKIKIAYTLLNEQKLPSGYTILVSP